MTYRSTAEAIDKLIASPWFFLAFNVTTAALLAISVDTANLMISIVTADAVILAAGSVRRDRIAMHGKLDALIHCTKGASNQLMHAEDRDEAEIADIRP